MDLNQFGTFRMIAGRLDWLSQRQVVLAQNIANADTPGYQAQDIQPFADVVARTMPGQLTPAQTQAGHMAGTSGTPGARVSPLRSPYEVSPSGNTVVLEQQLMQLTDTAAQHRLALNLYRKHVGMIKMALGRSGGS
ncbi:MAG: flagellar basal body rod protein FlgB [Rhodospirillaceae bacterium]|nr:flagellar basal body rod protein FlgB [Rhodospirillaceae bacterium]